MNNKNCENCTYARLAYNKDYVGCSAYYSCGNETKDFYSFYERGIIKTGWIYLNKGLLCDSGVLSSISEGLLYNKMPVFEKTDCCKYYKSKNKI